MDAGLSSISQATGFLRRQFGGLSARLLLLTMLFVMTSEVAIYVPSIARFRLVALQQNLDSAYLASLAVEAAPDKRVSDMLAAELLASAGARTVALRRGDTRRLVLASEIPLQVDAAFDLSAHTAMGLIMDAFEAIVFGLRGERRIIRVTGPVEGTVASGSSSGSGNSEFIEVVLEEWPLYCDMLDYSGRILRLSIIISIITAALVFLSLQWLMIRPVRALTANMVTFRQSPEIYSGEQHPSARRDEIGVAEREFTAMQTDLRNALQQRARLAALGEGVSKINHDLRNILSSARLLSDRLTAISDPDVQRLAAPLIVSIDRAVDLCANTLKYARESHAAPHCEMVPLAPLLDEIIAAINIDPQTSTPAEIEWTVDVAGDVEVWADSDQLYRIMLNLLRNAREALMGGSRTKLADGGQPQITISVVEYGAGPGSAVIEISDNGPGIPDKIAGTLFQPFANSGRNGGSGLGLSIVRDLMQAIGGSVELAKTGPDGSSFRLVIPGRAV